MSTTVASQEVIGLDENVQFKMTGSDHPVTSQEPALTSRLEATASRLIRSWISPTICINKDPETRNRLGVFAFSQGELTSANSVELPACRPSKQICASRRSTMLPPTPRTKALADKPDDQSDKKAERSQRWLREEGARYAARAKDEKTKAQIEELIKSWYDLVSRGGEYMNRLCRRLRKPVSDY